jgi:hypothetical protein
VLLDGVSGPTIEHKRGLRQGDPLSSYLLILAIDTLQNIFKLAAYEGCLSPMRGRHAKLHLSLYADGAVVFVNPVREEVQMVVEIMKKFGDATGLRINLEKSSVASICCQDLDMDDVLSSFTGQRVGFPLTYLGLPLVLGRLQLVHVQRDKALAKLSGWQCKLLNPVDEECWFGPCLAPCLFTC